MNLCVYVHLLNKNVHNKYEKKKIQLTVYCLNFNYNYINDKKQIIKQEQTKKKKIVLSFSNTHMYFVLISFHFINN